MLAKDNLFLIKKMKLLKVFNLILIQLIISCAFTECISINTNKSDDAFALIIAEVKENKLLEGTIPENRIDYRYGFLEDLINFENKDVHLFHGKLKEDLCLVNYHDKSKPLGIGPGTRSMRWAGTQSEAILLTTIDEACQHYALVWPDWGERNAISYLFIPKGTELTFIEGIAKAQLSQSGIVFKGGGRQYRFRDFDTNWITKTKELNDEPFEYLSIEEK